METIDIDTEAPFDPGEWIGKGRKWPLRSSEVPSGLWNYRKDRLTVPSCLSPRTICSPDMSVAAFISYTNLPAQDKVLVFNNVETYFTPQPPNVNATNLLSQPIPSQALVKRLMEHVGQALLDGAQSVRYPPTAKVHFPIWILQYWMEIDRILEIQRRWRDCAAWLSQKRPYDPATEHVFEHASERLQMLSWNADTRALGTVATTSIFASLLSDDWLSDSHIDMMVAHLQKRLQLSRVDHTRIESLAFSYALLFVSAPEEYDRPSPHYLQPIEAAVAKDKFLQLYFPAFVDEAKHWIAIKIDFYRKHIHFTTGDSLYSKVYKPQPLITKLLLRVSIFPLS
ncbi:hypothetical protein K474DRAFT_1733076 [Panus rudis PR-1116 ss-1]|nr:hypothetical protein K474DRAFT_1733076 [Panus rudis PR-1116 ss-1]